MADAPARLDEEQVRKVAKLSRLKLSDQDVQRYATQLTSILGYVAQIGRASCRERVCRYV